MSCLRRFGRCYTLFRADTALVECRTIDQETHSSHTTDRELRKGAVSLLEKKRGHIVQSSGFDQYGRFVIQRSAKIKARGGGEISLGERVPPFDDRRQPCISSVVVFLHCETHTEGYTKSTLLSTYHLQFESVSVQ